MGQVIFAQGFLHEIFGISNNELASHILKRTTKLEFLVLLTSTSKILHMWFLVAHLSQTQEPIFSPPVTLTSKNLYSSICNSKQTRWFLRILRRLANQGTNQNGIRVFLSVARLHTMRQVAETSKSSSNIHDHIAPSGTEKSRLLRKCAVHWIDRVVVFINVLLNVTFCKPPFHGGNGKIWTITSAIETNGKDDAYSCYD